MTNQITNGVVASTKRFPGAFELFSPSVSAIGKNVGTFIGLIGLSIGLIVAAALVSALAVIAIVAAGGTDRPAFVVTLAATMVILVSTAYMAVLPFFTYLQLRSAQGVQLGFAAMLRETKPYFWRLLGLRLLLGLIYFGGILLFIVPFFFLWKRYMMSRYYVVGKDMRVLASMRVSAADSVQYAGGIWGIVGVRTLWWAVTQILGLVGNIVDFLYSCAPAIRYLQIQQAKHGEKP